MFVLRKKGHFQEKKGNLSLEKWEVNFERKKLR